MRLTLHTSVLYVVFSKYCTVVHSGRRKISNNRTTVIQERQLHEDAWHMGRAGHHAIRHMVLSQKHFLFRVLPHLLHRHCHCASTRLLAIGKTRTMRLGGTYAGVLQMLRTSMHLFQVRRVVGVRDVVGARPADATTPSTATTSAPATVPNQTNATSPPLVPRQKHATAGKNVLAIVPKNHLTVRRSS